MNADEFCAFDIVHASGNIKDAEDEIKHWFKESEIIDYVHIQEKKLNFNIAIESSVMKFIIGDKKRIRQILLNLINNSIKFTEIDPVVGNLKPTQNEIDVDKSLKFPLL